jgi:glycosyltransferase involved in cell wall biosynthesis
VKFYRAKSTNINKINNNLMKNSKLYNEFKNTNLLFITQKNNWGVDLEHYLPKYFCLALFIFIPPVYSYDRIILIKMFKNNKLETKNIIIPYIPPNLPYFRLFLLPLCHLIRFSYVICFIIKSNIKFDYCISVSYNLGGVGLLLQKMKITKTVIYMSCDYFPQPIKLSVYSFFNRLANLIDTYCIRHSNLVWHPSKKLIEIKTQTGIINKNSPLQYEFPYGIDEKKIRFTELNEIQLHTLGFIGVIGYNSGLDLLIKSIHNLKKKIPDIKLHVIGSGNYEKTSKQLVQDMGLVNNVVFWGYINDDEKVRDILAKCAIGIAPYKSSIDNFAQYSIPGKVIQYLTCGLAVIITKVPNIASEIQNKKAGFAINDNIDELSDAIEKLLCDNLSLIECRNNAIKMALDYSWNKIIENAFQQL